MNTIISRTTKSPLDKKLKEISESLDSTEKIEAKITEEKSKLDKKKEELVDLRQELKKVTQEYEDIERDVDDFKNKSHDGKTLLAKASNDVERQEKQNKEQAEKLESDRKKFLSHKEETEKTLEIRESEVSTREMLVKKDEGKIDLYLAEVNLFKERLIKLAVGRGIDPVAANIPPAPSEKEGS